MRIIIFLFVLSLLCLSACAENPGEMKNVTVDYNSLLIIDEANQVLNKVDLSSFQIVQVAVLGSAANDILIVSNKAFISQSLAHTITKYSLIEGGSPLSLQYEGSPNPSEISTTGKKLYATLSASGQMSVVDISDLSLITNISLPGANWPQPILATENSVFIGETGGWANNYSNSMIIAVDSLNYSIITNIPVSENPQALAISDDGILYVACTGVYDMNSYAYVNGNVLKISTNNYSVEIFQSNLCLSAISFHEGKVFGIGANNDGLFIYQTDGTLITNLIAGKYYKGIAFDSRNIYVSMGYTSASAHVTIINKNDYSISYISNTGGGDIARY